MGPSGGFTSGRTGSESSGEPVYETKEDRRREQVLHLQMEL